MISVLHVMARMAPSGTEFQLAGTLRAARDRHWEPTLCVLYPGFALAGQIRADGIAVIELDGGGRAAHLDRLRALRKLARSGRFDIVHTSLWGAGAFGRAALVGPHRPAVVMSERRVEDFRSTGRRLVDVALARVTDEWIGNSADVCDFVVAAHRAPAERVHLVANGIDVDVFHPGPPPQNPVPRIGALGRLIHQKGFDVLLAALPTVLAQREVEVVIAGGGELRADLQRQAAGLPVTFVGSVSERAAVADFLRGLDVFVMPSRYEGLPNAVLEAMACGAPVVATDVAGMREAVGPGVELVASEDPQALAAALLAELGRPRGGQPAAPRSFDDAAVDHLRVFEAALARRSGAARAGSSCT